MADRIGGSVGHAKASMTYPEFLRWMAYFEREANDFNSLHWYLAQTAFETYLLRHTMAGVQPKKKTIQEFLLKFEVVKSEEAAQQELDDLDAFLENEKKEKEASSAVAKSAFAGLIKLALKAKKDKSGKVAPLPDRVKRGNAPAGGIPVVPPPQAPPQKPLSAQEQRRRRRR